MNKNVRYHVIHDRDDNKVMLYDSETGAIQHPSCEQDLVAYNNYLVGRGRFEESQRLLAESMAGNKPITNMLRRMLQSVAPKPDWV